MYLVSGVGKVNKKVTIKYGKEEREIMPDEYGFWSVDLTTFKDYPNWKTVKVGGQTRSIAERPYGMVFK